MPRFYFHLTSSSTREVDTEGVEFDSLEEAVADAQKACAEMLSDDALKGKFKFRKAFEITDREGRLLARVPPDASI